MRNLLAVLLLSFFLFGQTACAGNPLARVHQSLQEIEIKTPAGDGDCTAYAVGPHTVLTAEHCFEGNPEAALVKIIFAGEKEPQPVAAIVLDHSDHVLVTFKEKTFTTWLALTLVVPNQGDRVFMWGNPTAIYGAQDCYREGYFSGKAFGLEKGRLQNIFIFIFPSAPGDSGSAIVNARGEIVGVASKANEGFTVSFGFGFTPQQLAAAAAQ